jgi:RNA polymerase sigma-70 factor (ECF subfamily)
MTVAPLSFAAPADEQLLEEILEGSHSAFAELVRRHSTRFYNLAYRYLNNKQDAEDMVQNAFLKLWNKPEAWKAGKGAKFTTWFYRIIANQCLDEKKRSKPLPMGEDEEFTAPEWNPETEIDDARRVARVEAAFQELRDQDRTALNLCFYQDLPHQQAADIMGMKLKAFESLLFRAKAALKEKVLGPLQTTKEYAYAGR